MSEVSAKSAYVAKLCELRAWCRGRLGAQLALREQDLLEEVLSDVFGYHLIVVDPAYSAANALAASRTLHRVIQSRTADTLDGKPQIVATAEAIPLGADSVDAFVLPHVLELTEQPHQVLREIDRCLVAEGHVIILGFNPYSWWGVRRLLLGWRGRVPWSLRFVSMRRLKDWLSLLGFDTIRTSYFFPHPPWQHRKKEPGGEPPRRWRIERWPILTGAYILVARKRVVSLTPIKPRWRPRRAVLAGGMAGTNQGRIPPDV